MEFNDRVKIFKRVYVKIQRTKRPNNHLKKINIASLFISTVKVDGENLNKI